MNAPGKARMSPEKSTLDTLRIDRSPAGEGRSGGWWLAIVVLAIGLGLAWIWWRHAHRPVAVRTVTVQSSRANGSRTVLNASGYVTARRQATVSSKATGKIMEVFIEEGVAVKEGQVLAKIDDSNVRTSLELAQAQFKAAKAALDETRVQLAQAQLELRRARELRTNQIASQSDLDRAQSDSDTLQARLDRQGVEAAVAERQVAVWQQQLEDTVIRASFAGMVVSKNAQPGEMISPISAGGGFTRTGIGTIVDMDSLEIEVDVNESYINRVVAGQPVEATLDSYPDWKIPAKVIAIIPTADRQKATVKVRVGFVQLDPRILPDMGVKVAFQGAGGLAASDAVVAVPKGAVHEKSGQDIVWVARNGRAELRSVTIGASNGDDITIKNGLATGEKVIVSDPAKLVEGGPVKEAQP